MSNLLGLQSLHAIADASLPAVPPLHDGIADTYWSFEAAVVRDVGRAAFKDVIASAVCPDQSYWLSRDTIDERAETIANPFTALH